jgi:hypothetical protein
MPLKYSTSLPLVLACAACGCSDARRSSSELKTPEVQLPKYSAQSIVPIGARDPGPLAPGIVAVIYGERLGPQTPCDGQGNPQSLCGTEVHVGGQPAGLLYVSSGQINFRVPEQTQRFGNVDVRVSRQGSFGPAARVPVRDVAPAKYSAEVSAQMWEMLHAVRWDSPYRAGCAAVPPQQGLRGGLNDYAYNCATNNGHVVAESLYYPVDGNPPDLLLRRTDIHAANTYPELGPEIEQLLMDKLTRAYGAGTTPDGIYEIGASRPRPGLKWNIGTATVFLHRNRNYVAPAGVREGVFLIAVHRELIEERARAAEADGMPNWRQLTEPERIAAEQVTRGALMKLLRDSAQGPEKLRAGHLVAADNLVVQLGRLLVARSVVNGSEHLGEAPNADAVRRQLARYGVRFTGIGHHSGDLEYDRSLLLRSWREFPQTSWGQRALLILQRLSCSVPGYGCDGPNCFLKVIADGEKFLREYPDTDFRREQTYNLGLAHETWWALSRAEPGDISADGAKISSASGEQARQRAIELYEEVIRTAPESRQARAAKLALPRLKLKLSTGERAFFCFSC